MYSNYQFIFASLSCTNDPPLHPVVLSFGYKYHAGLRYFFQTIEQAG